MRITLIAIMLLVMGVTGIAAYIIYRAVYNKKINERLMNNESMAHNPMVSSDSMGKTILIVFGCMMMFSIVNILSDIRENINQANELLDDQTSYLENSIDGIRDIKDMLNEQNNPLTFLDYNVGEVKKDDLTVDLTLNCALKKYSKDTRLTAYIGENKIELSYDGKGKFIGKKTFSIFASLEGELLFEQEDNGTIMTFIDDTYFLEGILDSSLPQLAFVDELEASRSSGKVNIQGGVDLVDRESFHDMEVYATKNGEHIKDFNISEDYISLDLEVEVDENDVVEIWVRGIDQYGLEHRNYVVSVSENETMGGGRDCIYDSKGNLLEGEMEK